MVISGLINCGKGRRERIRLQNGGGLNFCRLVDDRNFPLIVGVLDLVLMNFLFLGKIRDNPDLSQWIPLSILL